jgi:hypothetical protein
MVIFRLVPMHATSLQARAELRYFRNWFRVVCSAGQGAVHTLVAPRQPILTLSSVSVTPHLTPNI